MAIFGDSLLYLNLDECTSCTACYQPDVCPVGAIYSEELVPDGSTNTRVQLSGLEQGSRPYLLHRAQQGGLRRLAASCPASSRRARARWAPSGGARRGAAAPTSTARRWRSLATLPAPRQSIPFRPDPQQAGLPRRPSPTRVRSIRRRSHPRRTGPRSQPAMVANAATAGDASGRGEWDPMGRGEQFNESVAVSGRGAMMTGSSAARLSAQSALVDRRRDDRPQYGDRHPRSCTRRLRRLLQERP